MYTRLRLTTQGEAQGFLKRNRTYSYVEAQKFWYEKGLWDLHSQGGPNFFGKGDRDESSSIA